MKYDIVIVGGGHAGAQAAMMLRQRRFAGTIAILGDEPDLPYERPSLSKAYLAGEKSFERLSIRPPTFWSDRAVTMLTLHRVVSVDPAAHIVICASGAEIGYGALIWAAGGDARHPTCEGHDLAGVHTVRNRADVDRMIAELPTCQHVAVVGGGYIGLEAAATLTKLGKTVMVFEACDRVLARVAGEALSRFFEAEHRTRGVTLLLETTIAAIEGVGGKVTGVRSVDGQVSPADMVVVGIGIVPAVGPLRDAGARIENGVVVDATCRTSLADVYAIGDCAQHPNDFSGGRSIRLESVQNANDMAEVVADALTGDPKPYRAVPWFWSDQYDLKLQTVGLSAGHDDYVVRGDPASRAFSVVYLRQGTVIALDCVNMAKDYVQGRALVVERTPVAATVLADPSIPLKEMLAVQKESAA